MKKILFILLLTITTSSLKAQTNPSNVLSFSVGLTNKLRVKFEHSLNSNFSVGLFGNAYYGSFTGLRADPFCRIYVVGEAPEGFYFQLKGFYGQFTTTESVVFQASKEIKFSSSGFGFGLGYQVITGKNNNFSMDFGLGLKMSSIVQQAGYDVLSSGDKVLFLTTGPGSLFDGLISIGVAF